MMIIELKKLTNTAYVTFYDTLVESKILFVSENDLECLRVFNRKLKEKDVKRAILGENIHEFNCKAEYFIQKKTRYFKHQKENLHHHQLRISFLKQNLNI